MPPLDFGGERILLDWTSPVLLMVIPPFSPTWVDQMESIGAVPSSEKLRKRLAEVPPDVHRKLGWEITAEMEQAARDAGAAGVVLMGLKFSSVVDEAAQAWPELQ